jgi:anti-sigma regulatory factor (Ser/Thr protein kinase)
VANTWRGRQSRESLKGKGPGDAFSHEALLYAGPDEFAAATLAFLRGGLEADEPMLVVVSAARIAMLRAELGEDADRVQFGDMDEIGTNPARIIPAWRDFVDAQRAGRAFRGIGEPIWAGRSPAELSECQRHEALLNLAFADTGPWRLLCPYDTATLPADVLEEAHRSHPVIVDRDEERSSATYRDLDEVAAPFDWPLPDPPPTADELPFGEGALRHVRAFVSRHAGRAGLGPERAADFVLAANEVATNSLRHGGGRGILRIWTEADALICEVADRGRIDQPLVDRQAPALGKENSRGLWIANQVCELVQIRSFPNGSVVRLHMRCL